MIELTKIQLDILTLSAKGKVTSEIVEELYYSGWWVKENKKRIYRELGANSITHAVAIAIRTGLIQPPNRRRTGVRAGSE